MNLILFFTFILSRSKIKHRAKTGITGKTYRKCSYGDILLIVITYNIAGSSNIKQFKIFDLSNFFLLIIIKYTIPIIKIEKPIPKGIEYELNINSKNAFDCWIMFFPSLIFPTPLYEKNM